APRGRRRRGWGEPLLARERVGRVLLALGVHVAARVVPPLGFLVVELGGRTPLPEGLLGRCGRRRRRLLLIGIVGLRLPPRGCDAPGLGPGSTANRNRRAIALLVSSRSRLLTV